MREYVLMNETARYRVSINEQERLVLYTATDDRQQKPRTLTAHPVAVFSADIDGTGQLHIAGVTAGTLTYWRVQGDTVSATQLMHLPQKFSVESVALNCTDTVRLNYCVSGPEGSALIEYVLTGEAWHGKNLLTSPQRLSIAYAAKEPPLCWLCRRDEGGTNSLLAQDGEELMRSLQKITHVQYFCGSVIFHTGESIYAQKNEIASGEAVYTGEKGDLLCLQGNALSRMAYNGSFYFSGEVNRPRGAKEYWLCVPGENKRLILSSPFPYLQGPMGDRDSSLAQEVYRQQRTIFSLQAELKEVRLRLKRLEEEKKGDGNVKSK